jgi:hypothetical protein
MFYFNWIEACFDLPMNYIVYVDMRSEDFTFMYRPDGRLDMICYLSNVNCASDMYSYGSAVYALVNPEST